MLFQKNVVSLLKLLIMSELVTLRNFIFDTDLNIPKVFTKERFHQWFGDIMLDENRIKSLGIELNSVIPISTDTDIDFNEKLAELTNNFSEQISKINLHKIQINKEIDALKVEILEAASNNINFIDIDTYHQEAIKIVVNSNHNLKTFKTSTGQIHGIHW